jgi:uncharacterized protein (UPF0261 family)
VIKTVAILTTLDTKGREADFIREELKALGAKTLLMDIGVMQEPEIAADVGTDEVAKAGGSSLSEIRSKATRQGASPILIAGAIKILREKIKNNEVHAVLSLGGTQGTSNCAQVLQALEYGFPKIMVSTVASGDTKPYVGIKDVTMMFAVSDILGLNPFSRKILANAAGAAFGMAQIERKIEMPKDVKGVIGMTNLGVLTQGAMQAIREFNQAGYEVITFHAIGAGGLAMEQMMKEGIIHGVFDYALGEIADEVFDGLRAANKERLTVAGKLGLPQVICPGGAEHIGVLLHEPNTVPKKYALHKYTFHNPYVFVPRLTSDEVKVLAENITNRLQYSKKDTVFMIPTQGVSRYSVPGSELVDKESDAAFFSTLKATMPKSIIVREMDKGAEDPEFVSAAVNTLIGLMENSRKPAA